MMSTADDGLRFAERLLALLDAAHYSATYKLATLLAIMDLTAEHSDPVSGPPTVLRGHEVADRVIEFYWPQSAAYGARAGGMPQVLSQSPQNDIPAKLAAWRQAHRLAPGARLQEAQEADPAGWALLRADLAAVVIGMPLAKLQRFGEGRSAVEERFIYDFGWRDEVKSSTTARPGFDDRFYLRPGVGEWLVRLAPLLRPLVQSKWATKVAERNPDLVDRHQLYEFLFGATRVSLERVRAPLIEVQSGGCFYCEGQLSGRAAVDHFIPWSRHPDNTLDNLVAAHEACNGAKSASLAALGHLERWLRRFRPGGEEDAKLSQVATDHDWLRRPDRTLATARAIYLVLPAGTRLWSQGTTFVALDDRLVRDLLAA